MQTLTAHIEIDRATCTECSSISANKFSGLVRCAVNTHVTVPSINSSHKSIRTSGLNIEYKMKTKSDGSSQKE